MRINNGITAYLQGGLGNQLFIFAAALEQSKRIGCNLYIDSSAYVAKDPLDFVKTTNWPFQLDFFDHGAEIITDYSPWRHNSPRRPKILRNPARRSFQIPVFREKTFGYEEKINKIKSGTTIFGYFQSPKYFQNVGEDLAKIIDSAHLNPFDISGIENIENEPAIHLHIRRGDYLSPSAAKFHGLTSIDYFLNSIDILNRIYPDAKYRVFTDSPEHVSQEFGDDFNFEIFDDKGMTTQGVLLALSKGQALVASNSSFSWWAGWKMSKQSEKIIIAPRPWQSGGESGLDLILPNWLTLDAR